MPLLSLVILLKTRANNRLWSSKLILEQMMNRIGQRWSELDVKILKDRVSEKIPVPKIADELGRCEKGVRSKGYSLGLKFSK